jgi:type I restriction enzyme, S subunit
LGQVAVVPADGHPEYVISQSQMKLTPDREKADALFLYYVFSGPEQQEYILRNAAQSGVPHTNLDFLRTTPIRLPPLQEQRRIAGVLGALDDKIECSRRLVSNLRRLADLRFQAALAGGAEDVSVGEVVRFHNKRRVPLSSEQRAGMKGPYPYYGATGIFDYVDDFLFDGVFVLVGEDGSVVQGDGSPVMQYVWGKLWVNNHAHVLSGEGMSAEMVSLALSRADVRSHVTGAVQPKLSMRNLKDVQLTLPVGSVRAAVESEIQPLFELLRTAEGEASTIRQVRDTLLPKLVSGRVHVPEGYEP